MLFTAISDLKEVLEITFHLSRDALHVHVGLVMFIAMAAVLRRERRFLLSFLVLLAACLVGEMADYSYALDRHIGFNWLGSAKDVVNTMFWPAIGVAAGPHILRLLRLNRQARAEGERRSMPESPSRAR
jgi:uncharacterized membrane protein